MSDATNSSSKKTAVILFNLGGPNNPAAVQPFLFNLFNDPAIINLPDFFRKYLARFISNRREKTATAIYNRIGGRSPILENTEAQAEALENSLNPVLKPLISVDDSSDEVRSHGDDLRQNWSKTGPEKFSSPVQKSHKAFRCFIAMRYWFPFVDETATLVKDYAPDEIILLPLYPQFSTTTTASSLNSWRDAAARLQIKAPTKTICCYPTAQGFIRALAEATRKAYDEAKTVTAAQAPRILFSAHGLPEKTIRAGDPYAWQCAETVKALVKEINIHNLDYTLCYQSRVGPLKWIGPPTDAEVRRAGHEKAALVVVPIAFVSEHSETLVELDMEYRHLAKMVGVPFYITVPTVSVATGFIDELANLVKQAAHFSAGQSLSMSGARLCPPEFSGCVCRKSIA